MYSRRLRWREPAAILVLSLSTLPCQRADATSTAPPRRSLAGIVIDAAGKRVAGATVTLAGATAPPAWQTAPEVLQATSDERGRFRVLVRECVEYVAWAAHADAVSELATGVVPGPRHELVLRHAPRTSIPVTGLESWRDDAPLRARLWLPGSASHHATAAVDEDALALPPDWPHSSFVFELLGADGATLFATNIEIAAEAVAAPAPRTIPVLVEAPDGTPVAGAEVYTENSRYQELPEVGSMRIDVQTVVGVTGADGRCEARVSGGIAGEQPRAITLRARKPGNAPAYGGWDWSGQVLSEGLPDASGADAALAADGALRLRLRPIRPLPGRLLVHGKPVANCPILVTTDRSVPVPDGTVSYNVRGIARTTTAADGSFTLPGIGDEIIERVQVGAHEGVWSGAMPRAAAPDQPLLAVDPKAARLDLDITSCTRIDLQALHSDGGPAANAVLLVLPLLGEADYIDANDPRYRLDPAGRISLLLQRGMPWFLFLLDGERTAFTTVTPAGAKQALELPLVDLPNLRIRVTDANRAPVSGAHLTWKSYSYSEAPSPAESQLRMIALQLYKRWLPRARSDADGWLELPMFVRDWTRFTVQVKAGEARSDAWQLRYSEDPLEVTVR